MSRHSLIEQFCLIQLQVLSDRESRLRKELQDCMIQREYLSHFLMELDKDEEFDQLAAIIKEIKIIEEE
jgi:hypothetical protein|tara:strand:- start:886 stop:1092 length:207 start_codon:yes stop_codon:yes gene_type:complete